MLKRVPFLIFRLFSVDTKSFEAKGPPFGFFWYYETLFFFNLTEQLFYSQYFIIFLKICTPFSETFIRSNGTLLLS